MFPQWQHHIFCFHSSFTFPAVCPIGLFSDDVYSLVRGEVVNTHYCKKKKVIFFDYSTFIILHADYHSYLFFISCAIS